MWARARRQPRRKTAETAHIPAPVGGYNAVDPAGQLPPTDAVYMFNMLADEGGLRARMGYKEWCTGLTGGTSDEVRSILPFTGSAVNGSADKLFAVTASGIWDVSGSTDAPTQLIVFGSGVNDAGYGTACVVSTAAGRFMAYCDEENGLYIYTESTDAWAKISAGTTVAWAANTAYLVGDKVYNGTETYICDQAGTSAGSGGPTGTGSNIADNTARWDWVAAYSSTSIGPSQADNRLGYTADPANFAFVTVWKNRAWFVEKNTARAWYLDVNSIYGTATSFNFGSRMRAGGPLVGLYNWSYDGGSGMDTLLVGISGGGDVVIYQGTDPSSATTFGLKGCWTLGAIPFGRRIATDLGGDLLALSTSGVVPLSKLVVGASTEDEALYPTAKVNPIINRLATTRRTQLGWSLFIHPQENALFVTVPSGSGGETEQLAMSLSRRSWGRLRDLPILSAGTWNGELYFGTADGRVCRSSDWVDGTKMGYTNWAPATAYAFGQIRVNDSGIWEVIIAGTSASSGSGPVGATGTTIQDGTVYWTRTGNYYAPVEWSVLTAFRSLGNTRHKRVTQLAPVIQSGSSVPTVQATAKYDFDIVEPTEPSGEPTGGWDSDIWGGDPWLAATAYVIGDRVTNNGLVYLCDTNGTSAASGGPTGTGTNITDGTTRWDYVGVAAVWSAEYVGSIAAKGAVGMGRYVAVAIQGRATSRTVLVGVDVTFEQGGET